MMSGSEAPLVPALLASEPAANCPLCPRLASYRTANQQTYPDWFNAPVPGFGPHDARLLVVGLAPGLKGANRTGRPFTGDFAGTLLYETLLRFGFAAGSYGAEVEDGLHLKDCRIVNAVRCAPPANLPQPVEITTCNRFLRATLQEMARLEVVLALGVVAHAAVLKACGIPPARFRFRHGATYQLPDGLVLADSYHVSRYNTSTGRLNGAMFAALVEEIAARLTSSG